jgi:uncharacterized protein YjbI with pentapeptide repeats
MRVINTVFKFNTQANGYSFFWTTPDKNRIDNNQLDNLLPKKISNTFGFSLGLSSYRVNENTMFIAIQNDWNISDYFGRQGLSLWQGSFLEINSQDPKQIIKILEFIIGILNLYKRGYSTIEKLLSQIALNESKEYQERFFSYLEQETKKSKLMLTRHEENLIIKAINKLDIELDKKLRIYNEFPLHEYISLGCLIGLQIKFPDIEFVGAGELQEYSRYNHISTNQKIDGFEDINISDLFDEVGIFYKNKNQLSWLYKILSKFIQNANAIERKMANQEHIELLKKGIHEWNEWRKNNPEIFPCLKGANLQGENLSGRDLSKADLRWANLSNADLHVANLSEAQLMDAKFKEANLENANLSKADLTRANFYKANLSGANLENTNCFHVDFNNANLVKANFAHADIRKANLMEAQVLRTSFNGSNLTGACIADWNINNITKLDGVICDYIYLKNDKQERRPSSGKFARGEFSKLVQKAIETVDLIFVDGIDWTAFFQSFQDLRQQYHDDKLSIQAIEKKSGGAFVIRLEVPPEANKSEIEAQAKELYEMKLNALDAIYHEQLQAKDEQIASYHHENTNLLNVINVLANRPTQNIINVTANSRSESMSESYQSKYDQRNSNNQFVDTVQSGGEATFNQNNYTPEQKQNLAEAVGEIQQLLYQLAQTNPTNTDSVTEAIYQEIKRNPTLKARLNSAFKAGGMEALKTIFNHPLFSIPAETIKGWLEAE